jgi:hypothetical protein
MPVPPQESAPSLSPRQSFGCQSPLPWVTGTDRTGILWALWQLQGFLPGVLFSLSALSHLEESLIGQQASRSPVLRSHNNPQETQTQVPQFSSAIARGSHNNVSRNRDSTHRLAQLHRITQTLPLNSAQASRSGNAHGFPQRHGLLRDQHRLHAQWIGCSWILQDNTGFFSLYRGYTQVPCKLASTALAQSLGSNGCEPPSWLTASVLFACTKVDTCHPGNCMRSIRTPSSHHLGNHVSF